MADKRFQMNNVIPALPGWVIFFRYFQIFTSVVVLVLSAYALSYFGSWWGLGSLGFAVFNSIWSLTFTFAVLIIPCCLPFLYFKWLALVAETLTVIFWLSTWACLASLSLSFDDGSYGVGYYNSHTSGWGAITAAAIISAFTWISFCTTLFCFSMAVHRYRIDSKDVELATTQAEGQEQAAALAVEQAQASA